MAGVRLAAAAAGIKSPNRPDLSLIELAEGTAVAAVFTRNAFRAAPVQVAERHLAASSPRYLLINTGTANAGTGQRGLDDALACCEAVAALSGVSREQVLPFSTGVIGEYLPAARVKAALPALCAAVQADRWVDAARAIMTTDTVPKGVSRQLNIGGQRVTITGIAKGAGMIRPNMATMLAFIATDAAVAPALLRPCLTAVADRSFNRISVDGDTSTNDACVLMATGRAGAPVLRDDSHPAYATFHAALTEVATALARAIVRDGEGATKFITVDVVGGRDESECRRVADAVAHSPLVKTAFFASDPNWGRILAAVGRAGVAGLDVARVTLHLGGLCVAAGGARSPAYDEAQARAAMSREEITVRIDLGRGSAAASIWTCDLSYDYVRINADYRT